MDDEKLITDGNRLTTLTYMMAGCLGYSIENLQRYLDNHNLNLAGKDKYYFNQLKQALTRVNYILKNLENEAFKIIGTDNDAVLAYEDGTHIYWYLFLLIVDRGGTDRLYDLRLQAICSEIEKLKSLLHIPGLDIAKKMAFAQVINAMEDNQYSEEDLKNLLQYENQNKFRKRKVSRKNSGDRFE